MQQNGQYIKQPHDLENIFTKISNNLNERTGLLSQTDRKDENLYILREQLFGSVSLLFHTGQSLLSDCQSLISHWSVSLLSDCQSLTSHWSVSYFPVDSLLILLGESRASDCQLVNLILIIGQSLIYDWSVSSFDWSVSHF